MSVQILRPFSKLGCWYSYYYDIRVLYIFHMQVPWQVYDLKIFSNLIFFFFFFFFFGGHKTGKEWLLLSGLGMPFRHWPFCVSISTSEKEIRITYFQQKVKYGTDSGCNNFTRRTQAENVISIKNNILAFQMNVNPFFFLLNLKSKFAFTLIFCMYALKVLLFD